MKLRKLSNERNYRKQHLKFLKHFKKPELFSVFDELWKNTAPRV